MGVTNAQWKAHYNRVAGERDAAALRADKAEAMIAWLCKRFNWSLSAMESEMRSEEGGNPDSTERKVSS